MRLLDFVASSCSSILQPESRVICIDFVLIYHFCINIPLPTVLPSPPSSSSQRFQTMSTTLGSPTHAGICRGPASIQTLQCCLHPRCLHHVFTMGLKENDSFQLMLTISRIVQKEPTCTNIPSKHFGSLWGHFEFHTISTSFKHL